MASSDSSSSGSESSDSDSDSDSGSDGSDNEKADSPSTEKGKATPPTMKTMPDYVDTSPSPVINIYMRQSLTKWALVLLPTSLTQFRFIL